ncbi:MAG: NAD(P)/FAD-dependent oxidoreductase [Nitrospirota bacterium]|nr:NAD(P)/FAD-dependent oxidoreductase [Nitrospirota bacterium]
MPDYDVIVVGGGGVNGLTCASYLGKAGLKVLALERRGQCGTHCDTLEPGIPGFLHNLHATWIVAGNSSAMADLELEKHGLELRTTNYAYAKTFLDKKNALLGYFTDDTIANWAKLSKKDAETFEKMVNAVFKDIPSAIEAFHEMSERPPSYASTKKASDALLSNALGSVGVHLGFSEIWQMNGFELLNLLFESEHVKTMLASLAWIAGFPPIHRAVGSFAGAVSALFGGPLVAITQVKGGSHGLAHALVKSCVANGVEIRTCCPVKKILVEDGKAVGVELEDYALFPSEKITAKAVVSNCTAVPTFIHMIGENHLPEEIAERIKTFVYDEQVLFGAHYAIKEPPVWTSADFDPGVQRAFMGYMGGETMEEMEGYAASLVSGRIHDKVIANWFVPTLADPTQAPDGCHTMFVWFDVPPCPGSWKNRRLEGNLEVWHKIKYEMMDEITEGIEQFAPGFKKSIIERFPYTCADVFRNNPSAIKGCWDGGSAIPDQFFANRPVPGVIKPLSGSRTFIDNLYLSNSIHLHGNSSLSSGYICASEVAEDFGVRNKDWWKSRAGEWYVENLYRIPKDLGVKDQWKG